MGEGRVGVIYWIISQLQGGRGDFWQLRGPREEDEKLGKRI